MTSVRRIVVGVVAPIESSLVAFAERLAETDGVAGANVTLVERDTEFQNVSLTVEGEDVTTDRLEAAIEAAGGSLRSIDGMTVGESAHSQSQD